MKTRRASSGAMRPAFTRKNFACMALALLPMACALVGVAIDEQRAQGYSTWVSACRGSGLAPGSVAWFTLTLLPSAVAGLLLGGLAVQSIGVFLRGVPGMLQASLAAHTGCVLGMAAGLLLCTSALPLGWMLVVEAALAASAATWVFRRIRKVPYPRAAKCVVGPISAHCAATENSGPSGGK